MNGHVFNACLLIGWLLVLVGGVLIHLALGLLVAGGLLIVICIYLARLAGVDMPSTKGRE